jgi:hypothetical protein
MAAKRRKSGRRSKKTQARALKAEPTVQARDRMFEAIRFMRREDLPLTRAAKKAGTTPITVRKYAGSALRRDARGRYVAKPSDQLTREMRFFVPDGMIEIKFRSSRVATRIAEHAAAVDLFLRTGRTDALEPFIGKSVRGTDGVVHPFVTDPAVLKRLANAGEIAFERLYPGRR